MVVVAPWPLSPLAVVSFGRSLLALLAVCLALFTVIKYIWTEKNIRKLNKEKMYSCVNMGPWSE
jgi:hypothetical protein